MTFLVVALQSEAKPLVRHFGLAGTDSPAPYRIYRGERATLVVSGVGRIACAAACGYAFASEGEIRGRAWINVGIAGHPRAEIGSGWLAHKIVDRSTGRAWYPSLVFDPPVPTADLVTVDQPELDLREEALHDMEAAAFFATASRFSPVELLQVVKVVSDSRDHPASRLDRAEISRLIEGRLEEVDRVISETEALASRVARARTDLGEWTEGRRFTVSQRRRLGDLLQRLEVVEGGPVEASDLQAEARADRVLAALDRRLRDAGFGY